jgi:putative transposon-encoded protein
MTDKNKTDTPLEPEDKKTGLRTAPQARVKFEVYGEEMIEKEVKSSGNSGRIYLPPNWVGHTVKIIKVE